MTGTSGFSGKNSVTGYSGGDDKFLYPVVRKNIKNLNTIPEKIKYLEDLLREMNIEKGSWPAWNEWKEVINLDIQFWQKELNSNSILIFYLLDYIKLHYKSVSI